MSQTTNLHIPWKTLLLDAVTYNKRLESVKASPVAAYIHQQLKRTAKLTKLSDGTISRGIINVNLDAFHAWIKLVPVLPSCDEISEFGPYTEDPCRDDVTCILRLRKEDGPSVMLRQDTLVAQVFLMSAQYTVTDVELLCETHHSYDMDALRDNVPTICGVQHRQVVVLNTWDDDSLLTTHKFTAVFPLGAFPGDRPDPITALIVGQYGHVLATSPHSVKVQHNLASPHVNDALILMYNSLAAQCIFETPNHPGPLNLDDEEPYET